MGEGQEFCRGSIALHGQKPVLILVAGQADCLVVRLIHSRFPRHRSDVDLEEQLPLLRNTIARAAHCARVARDTLRPMAGGAFRVAEDAVARVEASARREGASQAMEQLPAGVVRSTWRGPRWGSNGRKVGGVPSE
ncbi:MAG: hypothetical protein ABF990_11925 [Acetobacter sp.]|uniref:hypothetical protein n=1 Tax=Acetobacter sp. TaxID=440 RepID=UPI0039EA0113